MSPRILAAVAALLLAAPLGACVSLLPKSDPPLLYTFGGAWPAAAEATQTAAQGADRRGVLLASLDFPRAAQGDMLLTTTGETAAYIAETRWVAPAVVLFREALERRFEETARTSRLVGRGDIGPTALVLRLDVRDFQAIYPFPEGVPDVAVAVRGRLARTDGTQVMEKTFSVRRAASDNRVGAIVQELDGATREVVDEIIAWTDEAAAAAPPPPPPPPGRS